MFEDEKPTVMREQGQGQEEPVSDALLAPLRFSNAIVAKGAEYIRSMAPQLIALSVCLLLIPLLILLSALSGWFVWKNIAVGWEVPVYLHYGDGMSPYAEVRLPSLVLQQPYNILLHVSVPATESNFALGNFMTTLTLSTPSNKTLASIRRPAIVLPPRSSFWTSRPSSVDIAIPLISSFTPETSQVLAKLEIGRRDEWKSLGQGHGRELSVLSASLRGVIKLEGLRGLVARFPLLSGLISALLFLGISVFVLIAVFLPAVYRPLGPESAEIDDTAPPTQMRRSKRVVESDEDLDHPDERPWKSRLPRRNTGSRNRPASDIDVKTEASSTIIPESYASSSAPLRRRRSQLVQDSIDDA